MNIKCVKAKALPNVLKTEFKNFMMSDDMIATGHKNFDTLYFSITD